MFINFRSSEAVHANLLQEAFHSFDENKGFFKLIAMDGPIISESQRLKIFSPLLRDIVDSIPLANEVPVIILPDCSSDSITHLINILTQAFTNTSQSGSLQREKEQSIRDAADILEIDLKHLVIEKENSNIIDIKVENEYFDIEYVKDENLTKTESRTEKVAVDANANIKEENQNFDETKSENLEVDEQQGMDDIEDEALLKRLEHMESEDKLPRARQEKQHAAHTKEEQTTSLLHSSVANTHICVEEIKPVVGLGQTIPSLPHTTFTLPWVDAGSEQVQQPGMSAKPELSNLVWAHFLNNIYNQNLQKEKYGNPEEQIRHNCEICDSSYKYKKDLNRHIRNKHDGDHHKVYECDQCSSKFIAKKILVAHKKIKHGSQISEFPCRICEKVFYSNGTMKRHQKIHENNLSI